MRSLSPVLLSTLALVGAGCRGPAQTPPPTDGPPDTTDTAAMPLQLVEEPVLRPPVDDGVHLMRMLAARTDRPALVSWRVADGRTRTTTELRMTHDIPILGLAPDATQEVTVTFLPDGGGEGVERVFEVTEGPLPQLFPVLEVLADDPARRSPGWTLLTAEYPQLFTRWVTVLLDEDLELAWVQTGRQRLWPTTVTERGTRVGALQGDLVSVVEETWEGRVVSDIASQAPSPLHHEWVPTDDGGWSLAFSEVDVDAYPTDYDRTQTAPATIRDTPVVKLDTAGAVVHEWSLAERLDPERIGYDAILPTSRGLDWSHANGIALDPEGDGVIVSVRQQDVVVKLSASGDVQWLLGDPSGWGPEHADLLLEPVGELTWPYHMHAPALADDGTLWLFDNHNHGATPYTGTDDSQQWSRAVGYRVDEEASTVAEVASLDQTTTGRLFALALGDADPLPGGTILAVWGNTHGEEGAEPGVAVDNEERGWGKRAARVVELDPSRPDAPALDLRVRSDAAEHDLGWTVYRADRLTSPWGTLAE